MITAPASATLRNAGWGSLKRPSLPGKSRITPWWNTAATTATSTGRPWGALADFEATMRECIGLLRGAGITPVLMSLPPVDSDKYYEYIISKGVDRCSLLKFLGTPLSIYRYQELYSVAISKLARSEELPFVDVRSAFLECIGSPFSQLISGDGLHPTEKGYEIVARCFRERLESIKE